MWIYHGSPVNNIKYLHANSYVTIYPHIAYNMGLYYSNTKRTWSDSDLSVPYDFGHIIKFKSNRKPDGIPTLYRFRLNPDNVIMHQGFPFEFRIKNHIKVEKVPINEIKKLIKHSKQMFKIMDKVNF